MDIHRMNRKQLQGLCKKHRIPANLSNLEMANKLTEFFQEKESPVVQAAVEEQKGILSETESNNAVADRKVKKVRFSPEHELIEYTTRPEMRKGSMRSSVNPRDSNGSVEIIESSEVNKQPVGRQGRTTRAGKSKLIEAEANQKKRGMQALSCIDEKTIASSVDIIDGGELEEGGVVRTGRVTRLREKMAAEGVKNASNRERRRAKDEDKIDEKNVRTEQQPEEITDNRGRVTRSRAVVRSTGKEVIVRAESSKDSSSKKGDEGEGKSTTVSDERIKGNGKGLEEVLVNKQIAGEHATVEPQVLLRRSKRKVNGIGDSELLTIDRKKHEVSEVNDSRKTLKPLTSDGSQVDAEIIGSEVNPGRRAVLEIEEPIKKAEPRRSNRRKTMIESSQADAEIHGSEVNPGRRAVLEIEEPIKKAEPRRSNRRKTMIESSQVDAEIIESEVNPGRRAVLETEEPIKVEPRRSIRRKAMIESSQVDAEIIGSEVNPSGRAVLEIEEPVKKAKPRRSNRKRTMIESDNLGDENKNICPLRSSVPQSDTVPEVSEDAEMVLQPIGVVRRSRHKALGLELVNATNDTYSAVENLKAEKLVSEPAVQMNTRSRRNTSKCKPPGLPDKIDGDSNIHQKKKVMKQNRGHVSGADVINNNDPNSGVQSVKGSSSKKVISSDHGSLLSLDIQLSVSTDLESVNNLCSKDNISDAELTVGEVPNVDSTGSSYMNLISGEELAKSDTNAASKIAQLEIDSTVEKGNSLLVNDEQELVEQNITDTYKNDPEAQVYSHMENTGCNNNINDQVLAEGLGVSGGKGSSEARSFADRLVLGDQTYVKTDPKVAETEADECIQSCPTVADHYNDMDNLEASGNILENNNDDTSQTAGEVGALESYETDYTHSKSTLQVKALSSGRARHHGCDNVAEGDETFFHNGIASELAEADENGCSKDNINAINHSSEFDMPGLSNGERDARIVSQERGTKQEGLQAVAPTAIYTNSADVNLKRGHADDQMTKIEERYIDEGMNSEPSETCEGESSMGHKSNCDGVGEISLASLFDGEGSYVITPQENEKFSGDEQGMLHGSLSVEPTSTCNSTREHEANLSAEGGKTYDIKETQSELTEAGKSGCLKSHGSSKDEDWYSKYSIKDLNEDEAFPDLPAVSTTCENYNEVKSGRESSNLQETNPSTPSSVSEAQEQNCSLLAKSNAANTNQRQEASSNASVLAGNAVFFSKSDTEGEIDQVAEGLSADEDDKEGSAGPCISNVKSFPISKLPAESLNDIKFQDSVETGQEHTESDAVEEEIHAISRESRTEIELHNLFGTTSDEDAPPEQSDTFCQGTEIAAESLNDTKFHELVETEQQHVNLLAGQTESDAGEEAAHPGLGDTFCHGNEIAAASLNDTRCQELIETEQQHVNLLAGQTESDAEAELHNPFGTTSGEDAPPGLGDTFCQGTEMEMEGESRNECAITKNNSVVSPTGFSNDDDNDENQLKFLFATPVKIITPCKIEESMMSIKECSGTMKDNVGTESTSSEKTKNEVENNLCVEDSLSDNGGDGISEEMNEVESFELLNTSIKILSGAGYDGCEPLEELLTQNKDECPKETNLTTEEDKEEHVILLAQSCHHDDISSSGTHMSEPLSCPKDHNISEGEMSQSTEAVFELSNAGLQKSDVGSDDGNILGESSIATSSYPEVGKNGSSQKDVAEKGVSTILFSKTSPDCDSTREIESGDQYEGDDNDGKDMHGELHTNSEVAIQKSASVGYNLSQELDQLPSSEAFEIICKEAKGMGTTLVNLLPGISVNDTCEEQLTENTGEGQKETKFIIEDNEEKVIGQSCLSDEGTYIDSGAIENVELKDTSTTDLSETEYDGCEASEQLIENTGECQKETNFIAEDNGENVIPLGQSCLSDEETDNDCESPEENIISLSGSPNNLDKLEGCEDMLIDTSLSESLKSQQEMTQTSEVVLEEKVIPLGQSCLSDEGTDNNSETKENVELKDTSTVALFKTEYDGCEASEEQLTENTGECQKETNFITEDNGENVKTLGQSCLSDEGTDNGSPNNLDKLEGCEDMLIDTSVSQFLNSQPEMTQTSEAVLEYVANLQNSCISKNNRLTASFEDDNTKEVLVTSSIPLVEESAITGFFVAQNAKDEGTSLHDLYKVSHADGAKICDGIDAKAKSSPDMSDELLHINTEVAVSKSLSNVDNVREEEADKLTCSPAEHGSSVCGDASSVENLDAAIPLFNLNEDNEKKNSETAEENSASQTVQFSNQELHVENLKQAHTFVNSPASGCNEILKESDVAETIKEYIDSESSLSLIFENSTGSLPSDVSCENPALSEYEDCTAGRIANSNDEETMPSADCLETEIKEQEEAALFIEPARVSRNAADSHGCLAEGTSVELDSQKKTESEDGQMLRSTTRKDARTILIHGTPGKLLTMADMKENAETHKRTNMGDITAVRPAKRRALQDLQWK